MPVTVIFTTFIRAFSVGLR